MSKQRIFRQGGLKRKNSQHAYILMLTILLLFAMLVTTLNFMDQSKENLQISGYNRDSAESLLLAESAMNKLYGGFIFNQDLDNDKKIDNIERIDIENPQTFTLRYAYYVTEKKGIDQVLPSLLQRIANGEARNLGSDGEKGSFNIKQNRLLVENLFMPESKSQPLVFTIDAKNNLTASNTNWKDQIADNIKSAAAWIELVRNPKLNGTIQVYAQSIAVVGNSKSYVQRLIGNYSDTIGFELGGLNESSL